MTSPPRQSETASEKDLPPGAERFWGQFSESRAGRSGDEEDGQGAEGDKGGNRREAGGHECLEWCPICRTAELLKSTGTTPEIRQQIQTIQNEALQILKAFAATYAERTGGEDPFNHDRPEPDGDEQQGDPQEPTVTDISIE